MIARARRPSAPTSARTRRPLPLPRGCASSAAPSGTYATMSVAFDGLRSAIHSSPRSRPTRRRRTDRRRGASVPTSSRLRRHAAAPRATRDRVAWRRRHRPRGCSREEHEQRPSGAGNVIAHELARALRVAGARGGSDRAVLFVRARLAVRERELHAEVAIRLLVQPLDDAHRDRRARRARRASSGTAN